VEIALHQITSLFLGWRALPIETDVTLGAGYMAHGGSVKYVRGLALFDLMRPIHPLSSACLRARRPFRSSLYTMYSILCTMYT
jgi:hypothetical protein